MIHYEHWQLVKEATWRWPNFSPLELRCRGTNKLLVIPDFLDRLQALRDKVGSLLVSSGYRSPAYNKKVSSTGKSGPHTTGRAVDLLIYGKKAYDVIVLAESFGFTGIGISQRGPYKKRFIHLDDLQDPVNGHRPWIWSY